MIVSKNVVPVWVAGQQAYAEFANVRPDGVVLSAGVWITVRSEDAVLFEFEAIGDDLSSAVDNSRNTNVPLSGMGRLSSFALKAG